VRLDRASQEITVTRMKERLDYAPLWPGGVETMRALERQFHATGLGQRLLELVKIRVSQINGCAFCIDMHAKVARAHGETEQRIYALSAWRETPFFDPRERAALTWAEALTRIESGVPDDVYNSVREHFDEAQLVAITYAVVGINGWNRIAIAFRKVPGSYSVASPPRSASAAPA
jgi:AhpD family alkylhydroperoxidase